MLVSFESNLFENNYLIIIILLMFTIHVYIIVYNCICVSQGLIQIEILKHIEAVTEKKIVDLFDWIVGTSTGGIVALGLVYGELL